jgi:hypothetical protein
MLEMGHQLTYFGDPIFIIMTTKTMGNIHYASDSQVHILKYL